MNHRSGNAIVISVLLVLILGVAAFYWFQSMGEPIANTNTTVLTNTQTNTEVSDIPEAPKVETDQDLEAAEAALDQTDVNANASDSTELDGYLQSF